MFSSEKVPGLKAPGVISLPIFLVHFPDYSLRAGYLLRVLVEELSLKYFISTLLYFFTIINVLVI
jgi:hypothetical protein